MQLIAKSKGSHRPERRDAVRRDGKRRDSTRRDRNKFERFQMGTIRDASFFERRDAISNKIGHIFGYVAEARSRDQLSTSQRDCSSGHEVV